MSDDTLRAALRAAITNAYYAARNAGETMETAADRATDGVLAALAASATDDTLREAAVAVCRLWFTDNAPDGSQHVRKAMLDLRAALAASATDELPGSDWTDPKG